MMLIMIRNNILQESFKAIPYYKIVRPFDSKTDSKANVQQRYTTNNHEQIKPLHPRLKSLKRNQSTRPIPLRANIRFWRGGQIPTT
jgi:hypothetical protein